MNRSIIKVTIGIWSIVVVIALAIFVLFAIGRTSRTSAWGWVGEHSEMTEVKNEIITDNISSLDIEWIAGNVNILKSDNDEIKVVQTASSNMPKNKYMKVYISGDTLKIEDQTGKILDFSLIKLYQTNLDVYLPEKTYEKINYSGVSCNLWATVYLQGKKLNIGTVSGDIQLSGKFETADFDMVSGDLNIENLTADKLSLNSVSGDMDVEGVFQDIYLDTVSGSIKILSAQMLTGLNASMVSGNVSLYLPENNGFKVQFDKVSGDFKSDFEMTKNNNIYSHKDGSYNFVVDTISGDFELLQK